MGETSISNMAFSRTELLLSKSAVEQLKQAKVIIFGIGGVGSFVAEAVARAAVGEITLVDGDVVDVTNLNRQLVATVSAVGRLKAEVMKARIEDINTAAKVTAVTKFYTKDNYNDFHLEQYDYIVDAIDMVTSKLLLIESAKQANTKIISAMGAGNKLDPTKFQVADIFDTSVCPLARIMRSELRKRDIHSLKVVYSTEKPRAIDKKDGMRPEVGSVSFVPSVAGLIMAGEVIKDLTKVRDYEEK